MSRRLSFTARADDISPFDSTLSNAVYVEEPLILFSPPPQTTRTRTTPDRSAFSDRPRSKSLNVYHSDSKDDEYSSDLFNDHKLSGWRTNDVERQPYTIQISRRWFTRVIGIVFSIVLVIVIASQRRSTTSFRSDRHTFTSVKSAQSRPLQHSSPMSRFRDNLFDDKRYLTTFAYGGLTNQIMELFKLVHLAHRLNRVAILTELTAAHQEGKPSHFHTYFDLDSFSILANTSMVEWSSVKIRPPTDSKIAGIQESLSCWGWAGVSFSPLSAYSIKTMFWAPPGHLTTPSSIQTSLTYPAIELLVSTDQHQWLDSIAQSTFGDDARIPDYPDSQVLCFENLFYVPSHEFVNGQISDSTSIEELSPTDAVWSDVGVYLQFNEKTNRLADDLLFHLLGSRSTEFVAVHVRQGDFKELGRAQAGVSEFAAEVNYLQKELHLRRKQSGFASFGRRKMVSLPVVFATDSKDKAFIRSLTKLGWIYIDHWEWATEERFDGWTAAVLDSVILSRSVGFVGTKQSTFSYLAARRVESWNNGLTSIVGDRKKVTSKTSVGDVEGKKERLMSIRSERSKSDRVE